MKISFKMKLMLILFTVSATALALLTLTAYQSSVAFRAGKEAQLKTTAEGLIDKIDRNLFERYGDVQAYALSESARSGDPHRITDFINDMMITYSPVYDLMMVTDTQGKVIAASTKNKQGDSLNSSSLLGADFSSAAWFKKAVSGQIKPGASFVEDFHYDEDVAKITGTSGHVMNFTAPIRDKKSGEVIGVWTNRMSWSDVVEAIAKEEAAKIKTAQITAAFPYLVNAKGAYLLQPEGSDSEAEKSYPAQLLKAARGNGSAVREVDLLNARFEGLVLETVAASKGYATYPSRGWAAVLQIPAHDSQTARNNLLIVVAFVLIAVANIFAFWMIRKMSGAFESVVAQMTHQSSEVHHAADRISTTSQHLAESTTEQAAAIEETAASLEEITSMVSQTTQNAAHCKSLSEEGQVAAHKGREVISKMSSAMEEIKASNTKLDHLVKMIDNIRNKTTIINSIVSETRILSINASIEAARAGVHGKGFAVVAEEVGKLAAISGQAATEIRELLESSVSEVSQVVKDTQESASLGQAISHECESAFSNMGTSLERMDDLIRTIAVAAREQEVGIKQTNRAMSEMDKVTQSNSREAETLAHQGDKLFAGAKSLNASIDRIRQIVLGSGESGEITEMPENITPLFTDAPKNSAPSSSEASSPTRSDSRWKGAV